MVRLKNLVIGVAVMCAAASTAFAQAAKPGAPAASATNAYAEAVSRIEARGGYVVREKDGTISEVSLARTWATDNDVEFVAEIPTIRKLDLGFTYVTDKGIKHLLQLKQLEDLN